MLVFQSFKQQVGTGEPPSSRPRLTGVHMQWALPRARLRSALAARQWPSLPLSPGAVTKAALPVVPKAALGTAFPLASTFTRTVKETNTGQEGHSISRSERNSTCFYLFPFQKEDISRVKQRACPDRPACDPRIPDHILCLPFLPRRATPYPIQALLKVSEVT